MEFPFGAVVWQACKTSEPFGEEFQIRTLDLDPEIMGFDLEIPTNCDIVGNYVFDEEPPPGLLTATVFFKWWSGVECTNHTSETY